MINNKLIKFFNAMVLCLCASILFTCCQVNKVGNTRKELLIKQQKLFGLHKKNGSDNSSKGLGLAFSEALAEAGARVILSGRKLDEVQNALNKLQERGLDGVAIEMDISQENSVKTAIALLESKGEKIDILVNNAALSLATPIFKPDYQHDFEKVINNNITGTWYVIKSIANHMKLNNIKGSIKHCERER